MAGFDDNLVLRIPDEVLRRHGARVLDPLTAPRPASGAVPGPTAYLTRSVLVRGLPSRGAAAALRRVQGEARRSAARPTLSVDPADVAFEQWLERDGGPAVRALGERTPTATRRGREPEDVGRDLLDSIYQTRVRIEPGRAGAPQLDPWELLTTEPEDGQGPLAADLEHLMLASGGGYFWEGHGGGYFWEGHGGGYFWEGHGGLGVRTPVSLAVPDPWVPPADGARPVVVVVPDTGLGRHDWFQDEQQACAHRTLAGTEIGPEGGLQPDPEDRGVRNELTGVLDRLSGHGTFIAGIVRQTAPSAKIVALPVMDSSGAVAEGDLYRALATLLVRHVAAQESGSSVFDGERGGVVDVLNLSMGFYHQDGELGDDYPMRQLLDRFAEAGVLVVAAAGNDATRQPLYPAGWAVPRDVEPPEPADAAPLVSVGALNPDGETVAIFSNSGPWVTAHAPGVNVVSTLPTTFRASSRPALATPGDHDRLRATIDLDALTKGFGVWSGTSFAAPHVAGWLAASLAEADGRQGVAGGTATTPAQRAWAAFQQVRQDKGLA